MYYMYTLYIHWCQNVWKIPFVHKAHNKWICYETCYLSAGNGTIEHFIYQ